MKKIFRASLFLILISALHTVALGQGGGGEGRKKDSPPKKDTPSKGKKDTPPRTPQPPPSAPTPQPAPVVAPAYAELVVNTGLAGCAVLIDGQSRGVTQETGILSVKSLKPGGHVVTVRKEGYRDEQHSIELYAGRSETLSIKLKKILTVAELLANAEQSYSNQRYSEAAMNCQEILQSQPDHPQANLLLGKSYYALGKLDSATYLLKAIAGGREVILPIKHHHRRLMWDDLCSGYLVLQKGYLEFKSNDKPGESFKVPASSIIELKSEPYRGGRISLNVKIPKGNKMSDERYNLHVHLATVLSEKSVTTVLCDPSVCNPLVDIIYRLVQKVKE